MFVGVVSFLRSDAAVAMIARATQGAAMGVGALFVIRHTSPTDQGFYFAFISFGLLLQLCDFGLSSASLQSASHLQATSGTDALPALAALALRLNAVVTAIASGAVASLGWWVFARTPGDAAVAWQAPWLVFVLGVAAHHLTAPYVFLVEGGVSVARAWRFRLLQEILSGAVLLTVLASGDGLWALVAYFWTRCGLGVLWMRRVPLGPSTARTGSFTLRRWRDELWPFQWRVGLSAVSGFLVFQAFGPILFAMRGPVEAGRFSLSLAMMNAIVMVTTAWPISQAAHFGILIGRRRGQDLTARWNRLVLQSTAFSALGSLATIVLFLWLRRQAPDFMARFAGPTTTGLLIASAVVHHVVACIAVVLRSERRDPLLVVGIVGGVVTIALMTVAALRDELTGIARGLPAVHVGDAAGRLRDLPALRAAPARGGCCFSRLTIRRDQSACHTPDRPPRFSRRPTSVIVIPRSTALHMS